MAATVSRVRRTNRLIEEQVGELSVGRTPAKPLDQTVSFALVLQFKEARNFDLMEKRIQAQQSNGYSANQASNLVSRI